MKEIFTLSLTLASFLSWYLIRIKKSNKKISNVSSKASNPLYNTLVGNHHQNSQSVTEPLLSSSPFSQTTTELENKSSKMERPYYSSYAVTGPISPHISLIKSSQIHLPSLNDDGNNNENNMNKEVIVGERLNLEDVYKVAYHGKDVALSPIAEEKIRKSREYLLSKISLDQGPFYGINTGFGMLSSVKIQQEQIDQLQYNLLRSHACGIGRPMSDPIVRAILLLRIQTLSLGHSGVSVELIHHLINIINSGIIPIIPEMGSVGASGDLAPLAHLALVAIGEGEARFQGELMSGGEALKRVGIKPFKLGAKEGLAMINGTQFMTAIGAISVLESEWLCNLADLVGAMSLEAIRGTTEPFQEDVHRLRPHPGQLYTANNIRNILLYHRAVDNEGNIHDEMKKSEIAQSHSNCGKVQDPYSFRCIPQVHGASRDMISFVRSVIEREINSVTDNPLIIPEKDLIISGGNFHGEIVAMSMDMLSIAVAELGSISEQRFEKLINPTLSDLPPFLTTKGGLNSGFMMLQVAAASIVSANKTLCHPASVDSIPTSADKEDHVSMGAWAAVKSLQVIENSLRVITLELLASCQAIDILRPLKSSFVIESMHQLVRTKIPFVVEDRAFYKDFEELTNLFVEKRDFIHDLLRITRPKQSC